MNLLCHGQVSINVRNTSFKPINSYSRVKIGKCAIYICAMDQKIVFLRHTSDKSETLQHHVHGTPDVYSNPDAI